MGLTPQFLDELRSRTVLSALVAQSLKIVKAGREFKGCCPFHNEKTPSFYVNDDKGFYHCFGCSAHGDAIRWMTEQRGLPFMDAVKELAQSAGMEAPAADPRAVEKAEKANSLYDVMTAAQDWFVRQLEGIEGAGAREYLHKRGVTAATIKSFGLGFAPDSRGKLKTVLSNFGNEKLIDSGLLISVDDNQPYDRFRGRLMIPIRDARGRVIAFGGRILGEGEPKYLNSPETPLFDKGRTLYNIDRASAASRKAGRVVVVEGYMDVIGLAQAGIDEVVAPLGTALTEHQIARLWRMSSSPIICFDGDAAGQKAAGRAAERALPELAGGNTLQFVTLPDGQDPDDLAKVANGALFKSLLLRANPLDEMIWQREVFRESLTTPESRAGLKKRLDDLALTVRDPLVREEYRRAFKDRFWDQFGWRKQEIGEVRRLNAAATANGQTRGDFVLKRAILLGLCRYPDILHAQLEVIQLVAFENQHLAAWRDLLVEAAYTRPTLDEDLIDTILREGDISPIESRDLTKDLGFSFVFRRYDILGQARDDLKNVIIAVVALQNLDMALAQVNARFAQAVENDEWAEVQQRRSERLAKVQEINQIAARNFEEREQGMNKLHG